MSELLVDTSFYTFDKECMIKDYMDNCGYSEEEAIIAADNVIKFDKVKGFSKIV